MSTATKGRLTADWEGRSDYDRLRNDRLARLRAKLDESELGALLAFDFDNIRYASSTPIGMCDAGAFRLSVPARFDGSCRGPPGPPGPGPGDGPT